MSSDQPIRLTFPAHLVEKISALLVYDIARQLDVALKLELEEALKAADSARTDATRAALIDGAAAEQKSNNTDRGDGEDPSKAEADAQIPVDPPAPPTIAEETLENVSRWADSKLGRGILRRYNLEAAEYSLIALLAGTQIYIPPSRLARLKAAEPVDKPNPYLPTYLSPQPPSIGREFSSLTKQLTTVLNVLFSIFGSAFAVYVAGTTGAGYTRETSILLGILAGAVVGIAEAILVWIFSARVKEGRRERWERGARMGKGSAGLGVKGGDRGDEADGGTALEGRPLAALAAGGEMEGTDGDDDEVPESQAAFEVEEGVGSVTDTSAMVGGAGRGIRLRRRAIGSTA